MRHAVNTRPHRRRGITLVEVAIGILSLGLLIGAGIALYDRAQQQKYILVTHDHMDQIVEALSVYAETAGRVPCPADPSATDITFGWEYAVTTTTLQVGAGQFPTGSCSGANNEGIVPFLTLNLSDNIARDGWGHYFTYAISPQFARNNDQSHNPNGTVNTAADVGSIHARCRTEGWAGLYDNHNISTVKARFCCDDQLTTAWNTNAYPASAPDLTIMFTDQTTTLSPARGATSATLPTLPAQYSNVNGVTNTIPTTIPNNIYDSLTDTLMSNNPPATGHTLPAALSSAQSSVLTPAFVLISHGQSGEGAYLSNGTQNRAASPTGLDSLNAAAGISAATFYDGPTNLNTGANYFDNIVRWMTQDSLMAAHGAESCQYP